MTWTLAPNFSACPVGPFTNASKKLAFAGLPASTSLVDYDGSGKFFSIVRPTASVAQCLQMLYPANSTGMGNQCFFIRCGVADAPLTLAWDHMWVLGGDISEGPLKLAPQIRWECVNTEPGMDQMIIVSDAKSQAKPYDMIIQGPRGRQYVQPICPSMGNVQWGVWTHWRIRYDPHGRTCAFWQNGTLLREEEDIPSDPTWQCGFFFAYWAGGGPGSGPKVDTYARMANVSMTVG